MCVCSDGFVVVNQTSETFPLTHGCCLGRSGPAAFASHLPLAAHPNVASKAIYTGSQWAILSYAPFSCNLPHAAYV